MSTARPKRAPVSVTSRVDALIEDLGWSTRPVLSHPDEFAFVELARELETDNTALRKQVASLRRRRAARVQTQVMHPYTKGL